MKLAIVILSYNHPELTSTTLRSVLDLTQENIYLMHNGSEAKHASRLRAEFPEVTHISLKENRGYTGGANAALSAVFKRSEWALFLTNDCFLESLPNPETLRDPAFLAPLIKVRKTGRIDSLGGSFTPKRGEIFHCKTAEQFSAAKNVYLPGTAFLIHRDIFHALKGFDESLGTYWEDVDFSQRVLQNGFRIALAPEVQLRHQIGKTCHKHKEYTLYLFHRNRKRVSWKFATPFEKPVLALHLLSSWIRQALRLISLGRRGDLRYLFRAIQD
jgi:GT2 family glycosyltransferase